MDEVKRWYVEGDGWEILEWEQGDYVQATDYDDLLEKYKTLEASIPARERAAFKAGMGEYCDSHIWRRLDQIALTRYPDKESK